MHAAPGWRTRCTRETDVCVRRVWVCHVRTVALCVECLYRSLDRPCVYCRETSNGVFHGRVSRSSDEMWDEHVEMRAVGVRGFYLHQLLVVERPRSTCRAVV